MKFHLERHIVISFLIVGAVLFGLGIFSFTSTYQLMSTIRLLSHGVRVINKSEETKKILADMETAVRGYIITGDSVFLQPYFVSVAAIPGLQKQLDSLTKDYANQTKNLALLSSLIDRKVNTSHNNINARNRSFEEARNMVQTYHGKIIMDSLRAAIDAIQNTEREFYRSQSTVSGRQLAVSQYSIVALSVVVLIVIVVLFYTLNRQSLKRQKEEQTVKRISAEIHELYNNAPCGYLSVGQDIYLTNINKTLLGWLGYTSEEVVGKLKFEDLLSPDSRAKFLASFEKDFEEYKRTGHVRNLEFDFMGKDGSTFPVIVNSAAKFDEVGNFVKSNTTVMDDSDRKVSENKFKNFLDSSPDALIIVDRDGIIQLANRQCDEVFGYAKEELIGHPVEKLIPSSVRSQHIGHREKYFHSPKARPMGIGIDLMAVRKDGREFPVEISLRPIETHEGILVSAAIRDVSEQKAHLNKIKQLNDELNAFTYSVSHDLRAPLRSINGFANILTEDYQDKLDEEGRKVLSTITRNATRMGQLIDDMLHFSRVGQLEIKKSSVDMNALVNKVISEIPDLEAKKTNLRVSKLKPAAADLDMITQVWANYLVNAIKFSGKKPEPQIEISSCEEGDEIVYSVRDNGSGFDNQYTHKLFGVFQRLHKLSEFEGTGVGLAIVKRIVEKHSGRVWAEGKPDMGATFYFSLPKE